MDTEPVADGALLDKWRRVQADITKDLEVVAQCQVSISGGRHRFQAIHPPLPYFGRIVLDFPYRARFRKA
jgi:hypothetical protein